MKKLLLLAVFTLGLFGSVVAQEVTEKDKKMKNPTEATKENLREAKNLYAVNCKACHGTLGLGDGTKAKNMKGDLGDFSSAKFQDQTDGTLFAKTKNKIGDHPGFSKKLSDEDIWIVVNYVRTLKK
ncbi:MAG TPA: c-type cytochrome [Lutibacter sp.]